jgi:hypothetical protein
VKRLLFLLTSGALLAVTLVPGVASAQVADDGQQALQQARPAAQIFGRQVGFSPDQVTQLSAIAVVVARVRGADVAQTSDQLTAALLGNQASANALGLDLDPGYVAYTQIDGATVEVFNGLDASTQATLRYQALVAQLPGLLHGTLNTAGA